LKKDAFEKLNSADVVIGPSANVGYYLIGCKQHRLLPSIFHDIRWSTVGVFTETLKRFFGSGLKFAPLTQWFDIDEFDDLVNFYKRNINRSEESQVMKFLTTKGIINEGKS
jgi:uncharacterized protein